jgi:hypothetical protein
MNPGEMTLAGQTVLTLVDLGRLRVETTDLSEREDGLVKTHAQSACFKG